MVLIIAIYLLLLKEKVFGKNFLDGITYQRPYFLFFSMLYRSKSLQVKWATDFIFIELILNCLGVFSVSQPGFIGLLLPVI